MEMFKSETNGEQEQLRRTYYGLTILSKFALEIIRQSFLSIPRQFYEYSDHPSHQTRQQIPGMESEMESEEDQLRQTIIRLWKEVLTELRNYPNTSGSEQGVQRETILVEDLLIEFFPSAYGLQDFGTYIEELGQLSEIQLGEIKEKFEEFCVSLLEVIDYTCQETPSEFPLPDLLLDSAEIAYHLALYAKTRPLRSYPPVDYIAKLIFGITKNNFKQHINGTQLDLNIDEFNQHIRDIHLLGYIPRDSQIYDYLKRYLNQFGGPEGNLYRFLKEYTYGEGEVGYLKLIAWQLLIIILILPIEYDPDIEQPANDPTQAPGQNPVQLWNDFFVSPVKNAAIEPGYSAIIATITKGEIDSGELLQLQKELENISRWLTAIEKVLEDPMFHWLSFVVVGVVQQSNVNTYFAHAELIMHVIHLVLKMVNNVIDQQNNLIDNHSELVRESMHFQQVNSKLKNVLKMISRHLKYIRVILYPGASENNEPSTAGLDQSQLQKLRILRNDINDIFNAALQNLNGLP
ncbi:hypothetical protein D6810_02000 [Candidatus Dojkabacteria bacterium]|uniref:Uncharacterized protein n=1 Tax=Candidatus Dojkabacteria bacterium TaxID=2099670 RepID=A0A3M0Z059_9BACT|nr:MAG: hypothetical protein D6810_02000 [Candidatus Dojkabacteria bacterium]